MQFQEFRLWENAAPFAQNGDGLMPENGNWERITDVSVPTITFFPASGAGPHPAVLVSPGGGYRFLSYHHEGIDICEMFNAAGFSAFLLKYRCPDRRDAAHADAVRAMRLIRTNAEKFAVDPDKIGAMGFSAGAHLTATICAPAAETVYPAADAIDQFPYRPDFAALIYPAYLCDDDLRIAPEFAVNENTPPMILIQTEDDPIRVENSLGFYLALKRAGVPAEMHLYAEGGHGYGLRRTGKPVSGWGNPVCDFFRRQTKMP